MKKIEKKVSEKVIGGGNKNVFLYDEITKECTVYRTDKHGNKTQKIGIVTRNYCFDGY